MLLDDSCTSQGQATAVLGVETSRVKGQASGETRPLMGSSECAHIFGVWPPGLKTVGGHVMPSKNNEQEFSRVSHMHRLQQRG